MKLKVNKKEAEASFLLQHYIIFFAAFVKLTENCKTEVFVYVERYCKVIIFKFIIGLEYKKSLRMRL